MEDHTSLHLQGSNTESAAHVFAVTEEPKLENHHIHGDGESDVAESVNSDVVDDESLEYGYCFCDLYSVICSKYTSSTGQ